MTREYNRILAIILSVFLLASCSYNPFSYNNHTTGDPAAAGIGAAIGAGSVALINGPKYMMVGAGIGGGVLGYYSSTLRFASGGVVQTGGQAFQIGQYVTIYIPTDKLFEANTADFLPTAKPILDSAVSILERYPNNNILVSGNTSGFGRARWERRLSTARAEKVSAYLWEEGINNFKRPSNNFRYLNYVGYGDYFPISSTRYNSGIRKNSHIQISSYPNTADFYPCRRDTALNGNIGDVGENVGYKVCEPPCANNDFKD